MKRVTKLSLVISKTRKSIQIEVHSCAKIRVEATSSIVEKKGILISGSGGHAGDRSGSVEVLNADGTPLCSLPDLS